MPNKTVLGYTQVPVAAKDILSVTHDRANDAGTATTVTVRYQVRDDSDVVRNGNRVINFTGGAYPVTGATILSNCNANEGT